MKPPFKHKVDCSRGAPMGRVEGYFEPGLYFHQVLPPPNKTPMLYLCKVPINSGGYDQGGAYWGLGEQLWCAWSETQDFIYYLRAGSQAKAKLEIWKDLPSVRFYR